MFMNEQKLYEYKLNKIKDNAFIVYITILTVLAFAIMFIKLS